MKRPSVLFDHQIFQSQKYGGISRYFAEVLPRLTESQQIDFSLFLGNSINEYGLERHRSKFKFFKGSKTSKFLFKTKLGTKLNRLFFPIFSLRAAPGILHFTYYRDTNPFFSGIRVLTVYDLIHEIFPDQFLKSDATAIWKKAGIKKADLIISISESTKRDLIKYFNFPEEKIKVVYLANSLNIEPNQQAPLKGSYLLFVGLRGGYKNFNILLRSLSESEILKEHQLLAFGGPEFSYEEKKLIRELGLESRVHHRVGGDRELATAYKHAKAFVFPSTYEGFGIPPLEAMHYGCPVVCSNISSVPEVVGDAALSIDTTSVADLKVAIEKIVTDTSLREDLISKGKVREKTFNWDRCAREHLKIYSQLLAESKKDF